MFAALRVFLASRPRTVEWAAFDIINTALYLLDKAVDTAGGQYTEDVARAEKAINAWMFEELRKLG